MEHFDPMEHLGAGEHTDPAEHHEPIEEPNPFEAVETTTPPVRTAPSRPSPPPPPAKPSGPYKPSPLPGILTGLGLAVLLVGGGFGLAQIVPKPEPKAETPAPSTTPGPQAKADAAPESRPSGDADGALASKVDDLGKRVDEVQKMVAAMPKPEPASDLKSIEAKVDALSKRLDSAPAPTADTKSLEDKIAKATATQGDAQTRLDALAAQSTELQKTIDAQKAEIAGLKDQVKSLASARPASSSTQPAASSGAEPAASNPAAAADYTKAVDLFKKNQFAQARDAFARLETSTPDDARVWYYAALANGFATNAWTGETERLVGRGIELEKSGKTDAATINAAFADLAPSAKGWLDSYRARAR